MNETLDTLNGRFSDDVEVSGGQSEATTVVARERIAEICSFLRDEQGFTMLTDLCAVDYPGREHRFEVVYHLQDIMSGRRLRLKVRLMQSDPAVASVCGIWRAANWFEREAYDLFGIRFTGHPDLKRLLTFEGFKGHPLRKDYPKDRRQ